MDGSMSNEEAKEIIKQIEDYLTAGNPIWDAEKIHEACQIAIKAMTMIEQERKEIADSVDDYLLYGRICPNMHDEIIRRILNEDAKPLHCKTDCGNVSCQQNQTQLIR